MSATTFLTHQGADMRSSQHSGERVLRTLQRYWGYESFRPSQQGIVESILSGRDACVVMPGRERHSHHRVHGQMDAQSRRENQEKWMADEARVMVGTIAFGLGIHKSAVRAVIVL